MRIRLERRKEMSRAMVWLTPVIAVALTMLTGGIVFTMIGYDGVAAVREIFVSPLADPNRWQDLGVKAAPLVIIATGLSFGFRANVWNIGAEGQYVMGALAGTGVALATWEMSGPWILPVMCVAGVLGGMAWAAVPALLRTRLGVSEILTSLMLTYVAVQFLFFLMNGPWKDPMGFNFPQTRMFTADQLLPVVLPRSIVHLGVPVAVLLALGAWFVMTRTVFGFQIRAVGRAPQAARHAGFDADRTVWATLMIGGGLAGLAGVFEAAGPYGQMTPQFPVGYGFTAIIVAFLGRLHPLGVLLAGLVMAVTYVGGETAQARLGLPDAAAGLFQAMTLFFLLATDVLVRHRIRLRAPEPTGAAA
jgi:simple sugar transport system permease protein